MSGWRLQPSKYDRLDGVPALEQIFSAEHATEVAGSEYPGGSMPSYL